MAQVMGLEEVDDVPELLDSHGETVTNEELHVLAEQRVEQEYNGDNSEVAPREIIDHKGFL